jgi:hypothetical protein
MLLQRGF